MLEYYPILSKLSLLFLKFLICCDYKSNLYEKSLQKNQKENKSPTIPLTRKQTTAKKKPWCICNHHSKNLFRKELPVDTKSKRGKSDKKQNIYTISKCLSTNYLIVAKMRNTNYTMVKTTQHLKTK